MEATIDGVKFTNVPDKRYGTKINDILTQSNVQMSQSVADYLNSNAFYALVNGVDIDWNGVEVAEGTVLNTTADLIKWIKGLASSGTEQIQADWNQTDTSKKDYIKNKPTIPQGVTVDSQLSDTSTNPVQNKVVKQAIDNKQDKLNSGQNIKTVNGQSILGSGNIEIQGGGSVTVDSSLSETSTNPVQNKVVKAALNEKQTAIDNLSTALNEKGSKTDVEALQDKVATLEQAGYITRAVNDLVNYYRKSETYTQTEINAMLATVQDFQPVIGALPASGEAKKIYFVPAADNASYTEYLWDTETSKFVPLATHSGDISSLISQECLAGEKTKALSSHGAAIAIENATSLTEVYTVRDCVLSNKLIKTDGTIADVDGFRTTTPIPISKHHKKIVFYDLWNFGANVWRSLAVYNSSGNVIAYEGNSDRYGEIDLTALTDPSYFRFAMHEGIEDAGHSACAVLISEDSQFDNLANIVKSSFDLFEQSTVKIKNTDVVGNGYALDCEGNLVETGNSRHYTSGFIEVFILSRIAANGLFTRSGKWAGMVLYDMNKLPIASFGGSVDIAISEIPTAKYFRFFVSLENAITLTYTLALKNGNILSDDNIDILTQKRLIYNNSACVLQNTGILYDGSVKTDVSTLNCTEKIPIGLAKYLMHYDIWTSGGTTWAALAIYDEDDNVLYRGKGYGVVDLSTLQTPSYFRFVMDKGTDYTNHARYDKPVVVLSMRNDFTKNEANFDAIEYIDLVTGYVQDSTPNSQHAGWGFNFPSPADINVSNIEISYDTSRSNVGDKVNCHVGEIDQRGWFILRNTVQLELVSQDSALQLNYYKPTEGLVIKKNEICIVVCGPFVNFNVLSGTSDYGEMVNWEGGNAASLEIRNDHVCLCHFKVTGTFAVKSSKDSSEITMDEVQSEIELNKVLVDEETGDRYKLVVNNGQLTLHDVGIHKILVIGNSFTTHENLANTWYGDGRGMAASVDATQYTEFIKDATGAELDILRGVPFETGYSPSYDFETNLPINKDYDCIIVQLQENATYGSAMQESWGALYDYIASKVPNAKIIQIIGSYSETKYNAIRIAADQRSIPVLDCTDQKNTGQYVLGCYVTGADGDYYEITNSGVSSGHPSDVGMYYIAEKILKELLYSIKDRLRNVTLNQSEGGTIYAPYSKWPIGGVVNIWCDSNIDAINVATVNGGSVTATKRTNSRGTFYTFIMPESDVIVTPIWD